MNPWRPQFSLQNGNESESESRSVVSDSLQPQGLHSPWNSPGQNPGAGSRSLLQGIFPTQGSNPGLPHCRWEIQNRNTLISNVRGKSRGLYLFTYVLIDQILLGISSVLWMPKNWCFWIVVLEKTLESSLDSKEITQSVLKEINPEYSLEGPMLKLKLQYFGHLMRRADSFEKTLMLGKIEDGRRGVGGRGWDGWMASLTQWTWVWTNSGRWWRTGKPGVLQSVGSQRVRHDWVNEQQQQKKTTHNVKFTF